jgi:hypothetical protein
MKHNKYIGKLIGIFRCIAFLGLLFSALQVHAQSAYHGGKGDGYAMAEVKNIVLSIEPGDVFAQTLHLYPNPAKSSESITILFNGNVFFDVEITDLLGKVIVKQTSIFQKVDIPLSICRPGSYVIHVKSEVTSYIQKLVISQ